MSLRVKLGEMEMAIDTEEMSMATLLALEEEPNSDEKGFYDGVFNSLNIDGTVICSLEQ